MFCLRLKVLSYILYVMARLVVELDSQELKQIAEAAEAKSLSVSAYIRKLLRLPQRKMGRPAKKAAK
jgi:hypothetical protein